MKHIVIYIITFFLVTNVAIGQDRYRIEKANCSFILPETWELVSEEVNDAGKGTLIVTLFIDKMLLNRMTIMFGWDKGDVIQYVIMCGLLVFLILFARPNSKLFLSNMESHNKKLLKYIRTSCIVALIIAIICAILSLLAHFIEGQ